MQGVLSSSEHLLMTNKTFCCSYIISTTDPSCFVNIWKKAKDLTDNRHIPIMFFTVNHQSQIGSLLNHTAASAILDAVVAEIKQGCL